MKKKILLTLLALGIALGGNSAEAKFRQIPDAPFFYDDTSVWHQSSDQYITGGVIVQLAKADAKPIPVRYLVYKPNRSIMVNSDGRMKGTPEGGMALTYYYPERGYEKATVFLVEYMLRNGYIY